MKRAKILIPPHTLVDFISLLVARVHTPVKDTTSQWIIIHLDRITFHTAEIIQVVEMDDQLLDLNYNQSRNSVYVLE